MNRKYGWKKDPTDIRDRMLKAYVSPRKAPLPEAVDLRPGMPPVLDQGYEGSCVWNAMVSALMYVQKKNKTLLSRQFGYFVTRAKEGTCTFDCGCIIRNAMWVARTLGVCHEETWPYLPANLYKMPSYKAFKEAKNHQAIQYFRVDWTNPAEVQGCLADGYPIVFGTSLYSSFETVDGSGLVPVPSPGTEKELGGHAMLLCGYRNKDGKLQYLVRNSWGEGWGVGGYCWMPEEIIDSEELSDDFWTIRSVEED